jgi:hypothetical protein
MSNPYRLGDDLNPKKYDLNKEFKDRKNSAFYVIRIDFFDHILIKIGKTYNCSQRSKSYYRSTHNNFEVLRLIIFRNSNPDKAFEFDYKRFINFSDMFEREIIKKLKDKKYYKGVVNSDEYYDKSKLGLINRAIDDTYKEVMNEEKYNTRSVSKKEKVKEVYNRRSSRELKPNKKYADGFTF